MRGMSTKASLSAPRKRLIEDMQRVNFGRIEVRIHGGEPVLQPAPRVIRLVEMTGSMMESTTSRASVRIVVTRGRIISS